MWYITGHVVFAALVTGVLLNGGLPDLSWLWSLPGAFATWTPWWLDLGLLTASYPFMVAGVVWLGRTVADALTGRTWS